MTSIYFLSDPHFSHENIIRFCKRPFAHAEAMDEALIERWNSVVRPQDHVYCLGDVCMKEKQLAIVKRLQGHKRLICGNHDIFDTRAYQEVGFKKVMAYRVLTNIIFSHIPIHPGSLGRFTGNAHGHLHDNPSPPGPYVNLCAEHINYTPISLGEVEARLLDRIETL